MASEAATLTQISHSSGFLEDVACCTISRLVGLTRIRDSELPESTPFANYAGFGRDSDSFFRS